MNDAQDRPPSRVVWLASYPRSGSTWVRFLLTAYISRREPSTDDVDRCIPDLHGRRNLLLDPLIDRWLAVKTHLLFTTAHPWVPQTERAVYLVRDPRDVVRSSLALQRALDQSEYRQTSDEEYARTFIRNLGDPAFRRQGFGTWPDHVRSWTNDTPFPVLVVRYEDLRRDPQFELARILAFLGQTVDRAALMEAIRVCSIERLRAIERERKQIVGPPDRVLHGTLGGFERGHPFIGDGSTSGTIDAIAPASVAAFESAFGDALTESGYPHRVGPPSQRGPL